jgi:hypothetical protein
MKPMTAMAALSALTGLGLTACGGGNSTAASSGGPSPPAMAQQLDTANVLALAQKTSETSTPLQVDDSALTLTDTSETSTPIMVNGM